jgi:hypothetical protein
MVMRRERRLFCQRLSKDLIKWICVFGLWLLAADLASQWAATAVAS